MKVLGIESSATAASLAIVEDNQLVAEYTVVYKKTHSQTLLPMLDEIATMVELDLDSIDVIAVSAGPGSFTGLRIGSATAKGLALAKNKPIVSVPTVDALAYSLWGNPNLICPLMDARRKQAYTGLYRWNGDTFETIMPQCAIDLAEIISIINERGESVVFVGDGVVPFAEDLKEGLKVEYRIAPAMLKDASAASVASLGMELAKQGKAEEAKNHKPDYLRLSQAERERQEKERDFRIC